jgi:small-conductance mechanosensitive channel
MLEQIRSAIPDQFEELSLALLLGAMGVIFALVAHRILFTILQRVARSSESEADNVVVSSLARPTRWSMVALGIVLAARETPVLDEVWQRIAGFVMPALIGWIALAIMRALVNTMELKLDLLAEDNLLARRRQTRLTIFSRIGTFLILFVTIGLMLLSIPGIRDIGVTLMASAGLAALAVGAAAQPALKALIGGLQMALTEPIRIDDVVIIDGEWGKIEEIRTTYVVVKVWDERRLVVPMSKFLDESFQNWTRKSAELLGTVFLHLDPLADISPIRAEFERQIKANRLWDKRVQVVQVTDASAGSIEVRLLMSARDAPTLFDLRCEIRESMLAWLRENQPGAIAFSRVERMPEAAFVTDEDSAD